MVSYPLALPFAGPLSPASRPAPPPEPLPLSPQALPAASASALHGHCGDGAVLGLRRVTVPDAPPPAQQ